MKLDESACLILRGMEAHGKVEKPLAPPLTILGSTEAPSTQALPSLPCVLSFVPAMMARDEQLALRLKAPENSLFCPYYQRQVQMTAFRTRVCTHASLMRPLSVYKGVSCNRFFKAKEPGVLFLDEANKLEAAAMLSLTAA